MLRTVLSLLLALTFVFVLAACSKTEQPKEAEQTTTAADTAGEMEADNTGQNAEGRVGDTLTAWDQSETEADRTITQAIRKAIMESESLSMSGKNVKIITINGVVTLKGPVKSAEEKESIGMVAQQVSGVSRVDNQIEVAGP